MQSFQAFGTIYDKMEGNDKKLKDKSLRKDTDREQ